MLAASAYDAASCFEGKIALSAPAQAASRQEMEFLLHSLSAVRGFKRCFTDPDAFAAALLGGSFECLPGSGQNFEAKLQILSVAGLVLQIAEQGPHSTRGAMAEGLPAIILRMPEHTAAVRMNGSVVGQGQAILAGGGKDFYSHCETAVGWAAMVMPQAELAELAELAPEALRARGASGVLTLPAGPRMRLTGAIAAASRMAETQPETLLQPGSAEALAQAMQELVAEALTAESQLLPVSRATREAHRVVRGADEFLSAHLGRPIFRGELCAALGVSLRKLHDCFMATTGMSPLTYLKIRRLFMARRALRSAEGGAIHVKSVAIAHGFWHFGHFATDYRNQFGETPSGTRGAGPRTNFPSLPVRSG